MMQRVWSAIGAAVLVVPGLVAAVGLGDFELESYLGEPLAGRIVLMDNAGELPGELALSEAGEADYQRLGIPRSGQAFRFDVDAMVLEDGLWRVPVRSDQRVQDLVLDLVVRLEHRGSRQIRHYAILVDPPPVERSAASALRREPAAPARSGPARAPVRPPRPALDVAAGDGRWRVEPGQTLLGIAASVSGGASVDRTADALYQLNPGAFIDGNRNLIRAGATLRLPSEVDIAAAPTAPEPPREAAATPAPTVSRTGVAATELATAAEADRLRLRAPPGADEVVDRLGDWIDADDQLLAGQSELLRRDMAFARTELETFRNENENLRERVRLLEQRALDLQRLVELRAAGAAAAAAPETGEPAVEQAAQGDAGTGSAGLAERAGEGARPVAADPPPDAASAPGLLGRLASRSGLLLVLGLAVLVVVAIWLARLREERRHQEALRKQFAALRELHDDQPLPQDL